MLRSLLEFADSGGSTLALSPFGVSEYICQEVIHKGISHHIGDDQAWRKSPKFVPITDYNRFQLMDLIREIEAKIGPAYKNKEFWPHIASIYTLLGFEVEKGILESSVESLRKYLAALKSRVKVLKSNPQSDR